MIKSQACFLRHPIYVRLKADGYNQLNWRWQWYWTTTGR